jgi:CcmD family protein
MKQSADFTQMARLQRLQPGGGKGETRCVGSLGYLAAVNVVIWVGLFLYLWRLDRRISEAERKP